MAAHRRRLKAMGGHEHLPRGLRETPVAEAGQPYVPLQRGESSLPARAAAGDQPVQPGQPAGELQAVLIRRHISRALTPRARSAPARSRV
jgi:hypothetical protein